MCFSIRTPARYKSVLGFCWGKPLLYPAEVCQARNIALKSGMLFYFGDLESVHLLQYNSIHFIPNGEIYMLNSIEA